MASGLARFAGAPGTRDSSPGAVPGAPAGPGVWLAETRGRAARPTWMRPPRALALPVSSAQRRGPQGGSAAVGLGCGCPEDPEAW